MDTNGVDLIPALKRLLRRESSDLDAYLHECFTRVEESTPGTRIRVHLLKSHMAAPRVRALAQKVALTVVDYSIPRSEVQAAHEHYVRTGSSERTSELNSKARGLFASADTSGEGGEALLSLIAETLLGIPQLICKMPLKTNPEVHYHGVDGVHAAGARDGRLAIYWGESKLHGTPSRAIAEAFKSIAPVLQAKGGSDAAESRDIELIKDNLDLRDPSLEAALKNYLDRDNPLFLKTEYRAVLLIGFDERSYPDPDSIEQTRRGQLDKSIGRWVAKIDEAVTKNDLEKVTLEVFCLPFPSVQEYRDSLLIELGLSPPRRKKKRP